MVKQWLVVAIVVCCICAYAHAQQFGAYVFPAKGQTPQQQQEDENTCAQWAKSQTGLDPAVLQYRQQEAMANQQKAQQEASTPQTGRRLARAALTGAALGQMDKEMDSGAGKGAAMGVTLAASKNRGEKVEQQRQAGVNAAGAQAQGVEADTQKYLKAYCACLEGKGYSVK